MRIKGKKTEIVISVKEIIRLIRALIWLTL